MCRLIQDMASWNIPIGQITEQYMRPNMMVITIMTANAIRFRLIKAGTNCILASHPKYPEAVPVKSVNNIVAAIKEIIAIMYLNFFSMDMCRFRLFGVIFTWFMSCVCKLILLVSFSQT